MRITLLLTLTVLLGAAIGLGTASLRLELAPWDGEPVPAQDPRAPRQMTPGGPAPKVAVDKAEHNFGVMDVKTKRTHDFVIRNEGQGPLLLSAGDTSCRCTLSKLESQEVPPGKSTKVTVTWHAESTAGPYRQNATIFTNDPKDPRITLSVVGRTVVAVQAVPSEITFSHLTPDKTDTVQARVFCYLDAPFEIRGYKLTEQETADRFAVEWTPMPAEQVHEEQDARSGVLLSVTAKPGLPQGSIQQRIQLQTNLESAPTVDLAVQGEVGSDIAVAGRGWNEEAGALAFGTLPARVGAQRRLLLIVRGPYRNQVQFKVLQVTPGLVKVTVGQSVPIRDGAAVQTPLTVDIPADSPAANHLGTKAGPYGQITLSTNHPKVPQLRILLSFAIEG